MEELEKGLIEMQERDVREDDCNLIDSHFDNKNNSKSKTSNFSTFEVEGTGLFSINMGVSESFIFNFRHYI